MSHIFFPSINNASRQKTKKKKSITDSQTSNHTPKILQLQNNQILEKTIDFKSNFKQINQRRQLKTCHI